MLQVKNEADRYLEQVLNNLSEFVDDIVIVDDASTDGTVSLCRKFKKVSKLVSLTESVFSTEWKLRETVWEAAVSTSPDWLLAVDADEMYEDRNKDQIRDLINQDEFDWIGFRMYDFWGGFTHYREDEHWQLHKRYTMTLVRYIPGYHYYFPKRDLHAFRLPVTYRALPGYAADCRVKHFGWAGDERDRYRKYERYMKLDPEGRWGNLDQYRSILDPRPNLVEWSDDE